MPDPFVVVILYGLVAFAGGLVAGVSLTRNRTAPCLKTPRPRP